MENKPANGKSIASLVLGIVGMIAWLLPLVGYPITIVGIILGCLGRKESKSGMSLAGLILSIIALVLTLGNSCLGVILQVSTMM